MKFGTITLCSRPKFDSPLYTFPHLASFIWTLLVTIIHQFLSQNVYFKLSLDTKRSQPNSSLFLHQIACNGSRVQKKRHPLIHVCPLLSCNTSEFNTTNTYTTWIHSSHSLLCRCVLLSPPTFIPMLLNSPILNALRAYCAVCRNWQKLESLFTNNKLWTIDIIIYVCPSRK